MTTLLLTAALLLGAPAPQDRPKAPDQEAPREKVEPAALAGIWDGTLSVPPGIELEMVFQVAKPEGDAMPAATLDVPDQGAKGIKVDAVTLDGTTVTFAIKMIQGQFKGTLNDDRTALIGKWTQGPLSLPLTLKKVEKVAERRRPQVPKPPFPYKAEDVTYPSKAQGVTLAGTLTIPEGNGPFPAVVLVSGSGPQDRDESLLGHRPFLVLADALTRRGIAVLRADDRGFGRSTGNFATATSADFADDAQGGVAYLRTRSEVDPKKVGLAGHSEGGVIGPMVAARAPEDVAFLVLLAGTGVPGDQLAAMQGEQMLRAAGAPEDAIKFQRELLKVLLPIVLKETDPKALDEKVRAAVKAQLEKLPEEDRKQIGDSDVGGAVVARLNTPWMRYFLAHDPRTILAKVKCPVLAINGELDSQVPYKENLGGIEQALKGGGNDRVTTRSFPKLNHLFQTAQTGALSEYGRIEETMAPQVLQAIGDWIIEQTSTP